MLEETSALQVTNKYEGSIQFVDLTGIINKNSEEQLLSLMNHGKDSSSEYLIINFTKVSYINSVGISIIIRLIKAYMSREKIIFGYGLDSIQEKLFKAVGITNYILFYPDEYTILQRIDSIT